MGLPRGRVTRDSDPYIPGRTTPQREREKKNTGGGISGVSKYHIFPNRMSNEPRSCGIYRSRPRRTRSLDVPIWQSVPRSGVYPGLYQRASIQKIKCVNYWCGVHELLVPFGEAHHATRHPNRYMCGGSGVRVAWWYTRCGPVGVCGWGRGYRRHRRWVSGVAVMSYLYRADISVASSMVMSPRLIAPLTRFPAFILACPGFNPSYFSCKAPCPKPKHSSAKFKA